MPRVSTVNPIPWRTRVAPYATCRSSTSRMAAISAATVSPGPHAEIGADDVRVLAHVGRRSFRDLPPEVEHDDAVGDLHDQAHVVLDQQDGHAAIVPDRPDEPGERGDLLVVQSRGRLVEQQEIRAPGQRARELDALERAEGQAGGRMAGHRVQPEVRDQLLGAGSGPAPPRPARPGDGGRSPGSRPRDRQCAPTMTFCRTERVGNRARFWNVRPMPSAEIRWAGVSWIGRPWNSSRPRSGV